MITTQTRSGEAYVRRARHISLAAWLLLGVVTVIAGTWTLQQVAIVQSSQEAVSLAEDAHQLDIVEDEQAQQSVKEAQDARDRAILEKNATLAELNAAQNSAGSVFDSKVELLASQGKIPRNPYSGLGIPPQYLIDEMSSATASEGVAYNRAFEDLQSAEQATMQAQANYRSKVEAADSSGVLRVIADKILATANEELYRRLAIGVLVILAFLAIAAAFSISAVKARAITDSNNSGATPKQEKLESPK
mgnify:CR=1 FL=1